LKKPNDVPKKKLVRFTENLTFPHLIQPAFQELYPDFRLKGRWASEFFRNHNPLVIELGCGKGEYTVELARKYPQRNYIGIDIKGARLWRGGKTVQEKKIPNAAFIRTQIDHLEQLFDQGEVTEIWITFPDPQLKKERKRLTAPAFLERYRKILIPGGEIHIKTDHPEFFNYTVEIIRKQKLELLLSTENLYATHHESQAASVSTYYEKTWLAQGKKILYLNFRC